MKKRERRGKTGATEADPWGSSILSTLCSDKALFKGLLCNICGSAHERWFCHYPKKQSKERKGTLRSEIQARKANVAQRAAYPELPLATNTLPKVIHPHHVPRKENREGLTDSILALGGAGPQPGEGVRTKQGSTQRHLSLGHQVVLCCILFSFVLVKLNWFQSSKRIITS